MQFGLVVMLVVGLWFGNLGVIINATVGLIVTQLPALLEREYQLTLDIGFVLWITAAVFFHALGTIPLPFLNANAYQSIWWWDHFTHLLSASVVAAVGYTAARVLDETSAEVHLPPRFMFMYLLLFVMAFGVVWELIEFLTSLAASLFGVSNVHTQYGLDDTMSDLVFDILGAFVVASSGTAILSEMIDQITRWLRTRTTER